jgi:large repetitive protein
MHNNYGSIVYTDKGKPLRGARISVGRTALAAITDDKGAFQLDNIPPGRIDLFIDGRTTSHQGKT